MARGEGEAVRGAEFVFCVRRCGGRAAEGARFVALFSGCVAEASLLSAARARTADGA